MLVQKQNGSRRQRQESCSSVGPGDSTPVLEEKRRHVGKWLSPPVDTDRNLKRDARWRTVILVKLIERTHLFASLQVVSKGADSGAIQATDAMQIKVPFRTTHATQRSLQYSNTVNSRRVAPVQAWKGL
jgi:hypothetical protein